MSDDASRADGSWQNGKWVPGTKGKPVDQDLIAREKYDPSLRGDVKTSKEVEEAGGLGALAKKNEAAKARPTPTAQAQGAALKASPTPTAAPPAGETEQQRFLRQNREKQR